MQLRPNFNKVLNRNIEQKLRLQCQKPLPPITLRLAKTPALFVTLHQKSDYQILPKIQSNR